MIRNLMIALLYLAGITLILRAEEPTRFTVTVEGKGPDVILLPGLGTSRDVYAEEAKLLTPHYRLHLVQINGYAGAPAGPNATGPILAPVVEQLHQYIVANKMHPAVIGHSLGGLLTLMLAAAHPEDVRKMMIVDALPFYGLVFSKDATVEMLKPQVEAMSQQMLLMPDDQFAAMLPPTIGMMVKSPERVKAVTANVIASDRTVYAHSMVEDMATDVRPILASIKTPAVLLYPVDASVVKDLDAITAVYTGAYATMPNLKIVKIEDSRHFIMYDQPAAFDAQVQAFLK